MAKDEIEVMAMKKGDAELAAAKIEAQKAILKFKEIYQNNKNEESFHFGIKIGVPDDKSTTYLWYSVDYEENGRYYVSHQNIPKGLEELQSIIIDDDDIEDWMIIKNGELLGGWSIRELRNKLVESDKQEFDLNLGVNNYQKNDF